MTSPNLPTLLGAYNVLEFGQITSGAGDAGPVINHAMDVISAERNGTLFLPPMTYVIRTAVVHRSNISVIGFGSATILQLRASAGIDVWTSRSTSNIRLASLRIDGNRANNTDSRHGLWLESVTDGWIEDVEAVSCRSDGIRLDGCTRIGMKGCKGSDNGRHGFSISYSEFCQLFWPRAYDNSQVESAGTGDGINLELLTNYTTIVGAVCYETAGVGDRQGYPIREASGEGCYRNTILGGAGWGNRTSNNPFLDSGDSTCIWPGRVTIPMGITITP